MRAVQFSRHGGPDVLEIVERPDPVAGPGEVVVEVHAVSANPVDGKIRSGLLPFYRDLPAGTGRDGAGVIVEAGAGVAADMVGRKVCFLAPRGTGSWVERIALPAEIVAEVPDGISMVDAASLPLAGTSAWAGLVGNAAIKPGDRVLIHAAAGGVGGIAVQLARSLGATVFGTCSARNADYVRSLGAEPVCYDEVAFEKELQDIDVVFDLLGGDVHRRSYEVLKRGGLLVCLNARPIEDLHERYGVTLKIAEVAPDRAALAGLLQKVQAGEIRSTVEKVLRFEDFALAQQLSDSGHVRGKIVLALR